MPFAPYPAPPRDIDPAQADRQSALDERLGPMLDREIIERGIKPQLRPATRRAAIRRLDELFETQRGE